jgi:excisionase family DNA binding protein
MNILTLGQPTSRIAKSVADKNLITIKEASKVIGIGEFAVRSLVRKGRIPARRVMGRLMVQPEFAKKYGQERKKKIELFVTKPIPEGMLTTSEAARVLDVCEETLRRAHRKGILRGKRFGFMLLFTKNSIERAKVEGLSVTI